MSGFSETTGEKTPSSRATWIGVVAIVLIAAVWLLVGRRGANPGTNHPAVGKPLSTLALEPLTDDAQPVSLDDVQGNVVLVNFWGPWCGYCLREMPHLASLEKEYRETDDMRFLSVSCSGAWRPDVPPQLQQSDNDARLRRQTLDFFDRAGIEMPVHTDPNGHTRAAFAAAGDGFGYPTTIILDRQGVIRGVWVGYKRGDEKQMEEMIVELLAE